MMGPGPEIGLIPGTCAAQLHTYLHLAWLGLGLVPSPRPLAMPTSLFCMTVMIAAANAPGPGVGKSTFGNFESTWGLF